MLHWTDYRLWEGQNQKRVSSRFYPVIFVTFRHRRQSRNAALCAANVGIAAPENGRLNSLE